MLALAALSPTSISSEEVLALPPSASRKPLGRELSYQRWATHRLQPPTLPSPGGRLKASSNGECQ